MISRISKISFVIISFLVLLGYNIQGQGIKEIYIECDQDEFDYIYANYEQDIYIPAIIGYGDDTWTDVLMRLRGDSSRKYPKKSLKLQFDSEPFFNGRYLINLNADYHDLGYMHSVLSSKLFKEAGVPCAAMEHVRIYLNEVFFGLYIMTENIDEQFLEAYGFDAEGPLYKASKDGACMSIHDNVFYHWDRKSGSDPNRSKLIELIAALDNAEIEEYPEFLESEFNPDNVKDFIAMSMLLANSSTYYHNYYLHLSPDNEVWNIFPWDLDKTLSNYFISNPYYRSSGHWTPDNPLMEKTLLNQLTFEDLKSQVSAFNNTMFSSEFLFPIIDSIMNAIEPSVIEDTTDDIHEMDTWTNYILADKQFIEGRYNNLLLQFNNVPLSFTVQRENEVFAPGQMNTFEWTPSFIPAGGALTYTLFLSQDISFSTPESIIIEGITNNYLDYELPTEEGKYFWTVVATDGTYKNEGFDTYNTLYINSDNEDIIINEINYNAHPDFDPGDWVELYNPGNDVVDLEGWRFRDQDNEHIFVFPAGVSIEAGGFLVLCRNSQQFYAQFSDTIPVVGDLEFGFAGDGDMLRLFNNIEYLVDVVQYNDNSPWPEEPDGNGPTLELLNPGLDNSKGHNWIASYDHGTPGKQNGKYSPDFVEPIYMSGTVDFEVFPNPFGDRLQLKLNIPPTSSMDIQISDMIGNVIFSQTVLYEEGSEPIEIETDRFLPGTYIFTLVRDGFKLQSVLLVKK